MTPSSKAEEKPKSSKLIMLALLNAYVQVGVWFVLFLLSLLFFDLGGTPIANITRDDPKFSYVQFIIRIPGYVLPILSVALIPARESRRWQIMALIAMLLNAGLMLLSGLFAATAFFVPMVGYLVSAVLVVLVLVKRRDV